MERSDKERPRESESVIEDTQGGDPGVTPDSVEQARKANPEQAPDLPQEPEEPDPGERDRPRRAGPSG